MKLQVKGSIDKVGATEFNRGMFNAGIFSKGKLLGEGPIDENGAYNFTLDAAELPVRDRACVLPRIGKGRRSRHHGDQAFGSTGEHKK